MTLKECIEWCRANEVTIFFYNLNDARYVRIVKGEMASIGMSFEVAVEQLALIEPRHYIVKGQKEGNNG